MVVHGLSLLVLRMVPLAMKTSAFFNSVLRWCALQGAVKFWGFCTKTRMSLVLVLDPAVSFFRGVGTRSSR